jgi:hypothetical protein
MKTIKNLIPYMLISVAASCATQITLNQIQAPKAGLISSDGSALGVTTIGAGLQLSGGVLSAPGAGGGGAPQVITTKVGTETTPNSFPIPAGKTCLVFRAITQSLNDDYTIVGGAVVFKSVAIGDTVQLVCW